MININGTLCPVLIPHLNSYQSLQQSNTSWNVWQQPSNSNMPSPFQVFDLNTNFTNPLHPLQHNDTQTIQQAMRIKRLKTPNTSTNKLKSLNDAPKQCKKSAIKNTSRKEINSGNEMDDQTSFHSVSLFICVTVEPALFSLIYSLIKVLLVFLCFVGT